MASRFAPQLARHVFTSEEVERLYRLAPLFDVTAVRSNDKVHLSVKDGPVQRTVELPACHAHVRVLSELCEKTIRWVYFHEGEHCARSLLSLPDARLHRLAELYRECGGHFPETPPNITFSD